MPMEDSSSSRSRFEASRKLFASLDDNQQADSVSVSLTSGEQIGTPPPVPPPPVPKRPDAKKPEHSPSPPAMPSLCGGMPTIQSLNAYRKAPLLMKTILAFDPTQQEGKEAKRIYRLVICSDYLIVSRNQIVFVYDILSNQLIKQVNIGVEVTALQESTDGALWIGTADGSILLLDCSNGSMTEKQRRFHVHSSNAVEQIIQAGGDMLSFDATGVLLVWPKAALTLNCKAHVLATKAKRVWHLGDLLYVSYGRTVKYYRLDEEEPTELGKLDPAAEGIINIAPVIEVILNHDHLLMVHEDGKITLWTKSGQYVSCNCIGTPYKAQKAILVQHYLWIAFSTGRITVIDIQSSIDHWAVISDWKMHQSLVQGISLKESSSQVASVAEDDSVYLWDARLKLAHNFNLVRRYQPDYSTFTPEQVLVCSWNVAAHKPPAISEINFWHSWLGIGSRPAIIAVGLQEVIELDSKRANAKILLGNGESSRAGMWVDRIKDALVFVQPGASYKLLINQTLVGLVLAIFVRDDLLHDVSAAACDSVKTGLGGYHGNKGSLVGRMIIRDSSFGFVNAHLAAGHDKVASRNSDAGMILKTARFVPASVSCEQVYTNGGDGSNVEDFEHCMFFGDLNYRIDRARNEVIDMISNGQLEDLSAHDQIKYQLGRNSAFPLTTFVEGPLKFPPTYKFDSNSNEYDTSDKLRVPAWCDRILYRCNSGVPEYTGSVERYDSVKEALKSDHRPIHALILLNLRSINVEQYNSTRRKLAQ